MSALEAARQQAREALELIHTWAQREQAWDTPRALDFARIGVSIRTLLDATEPPAQAEPAEDEREAMANFIDKRLDGDCGYGVGEHLADALIADGYRKGPRPITDEMVKAGARALNDAGWTYEGERAVSAREEMIAQARAAFAAQEGEAR